MFYNLIMIQWYNKSLFNWSCSFSDMSMLMMGLLFPCHFFQKRKIKVMIKNHTTGRNCQAVILYDSQFTHTIERKRDRKGRRREKKKKRYNFHVLKAGPWLKWASVHSEVRRSTSCNLDFYSAQPPTRMKAHFHSCVLRVWPEPVGAHPPIADGGWPKAIWPPAPFRVSPDICWFTWGCYRG